MTDPHPSPDVLLDLALDLHAQPEPLRAHVRDCPACADHLAALTAEQAALRAAWPRAGGDESAALAERIVAALPTGHPSPRSGEAPALTRPAWGWRLAVTAAAAALLVAVGASAWWRPAPAEPRPDLRAQVRRSEGLALFPPEEAR